METTGKLTEINTETNRAVIDGNRIVGLTYVERLTGLNVDQLREKINQQVTIVTEDNKVMDFRFE
jgi:hypothetical protein